MKRTNRDDIYVSPVIIADLFDDTRKEVGDEIFTSRKYKVLREGWIASMYAVALSMYQGGVWWLRPNPDDVAPDFFGFNTRDIEGKNYKEDVNTRIEVFEWGEHSTISLSDAVKKKVARIHDPKMSLVGHASKENEMLDFKGICKMLSDLKPNVLEVWILAKIKEIDSYVVMQVYPYLFRIPVPTDVPKYFVEPYAFISKFRGKGNRPGELLSINDQMEIKIVEEKKHV